MADPAPAFLSPWSTFYVVIGSSAAALTGLMFVVITIVMGAERTARSEDGVATFSTPTVMHFCAALFVAAVLIAPWHQLIYPSALVGLLGLYEIVYIWRVALRTRRLTGYTPDLEDWTWYTALPFAGYAAVAGGAAGLEFSPAGALYAVGAGVLLLVFIGIRNAWDVVTFLTVGGGAAPPK
ncbi:MAG TPA: hypothetical protein VHX17_12855 [Candidatus Cybelea sp.]|nr:hypothetical protein [Candidatus Cybelea sp.]